ncbi:MAG: heat-shock protein Hsp20 [Acidobacterium sp.]|nr:Hsp20/alpha crystallin family protein [Acidobacteriota bacterium]PHY12297.1 MAG: heat-shock protein Hsp20 [Acidobacterium sp.]
MPDIVAFVRWDPFRDLLTIQHRLERLATGPQGWTPAMDLCETAHAYVLTAELPGVTREQVRIDIRDGKLTLQGRREARVSCEQYHQVERGHGEFCRSVVLPLSIDTLNVVTDMRDGILTITLPKLPDAGPRRIEVS